MAQLIELTAQQKRNARKYEISFRPLRIDALDPDQLAAQLNLHLNDTLHVYSEDKKGDWHNGLVAKIDVTQEMENGIPIFETGLIIAKNLLETNAVAIVFSRDIDLLPPELHSHNGA